MKKVFFYGLIAVVGCFSAVIIYVNSQLEYGDLLKQYTLTPEPVLAADELTVQWLGNATVVVSDGKNTIMTDAWFSRPSVTQVLGGIVTDMNVVKASLKRAGQALYTPLMPLWEKVPLRQLLQKRG